MKIAWQFTKYGAAAAASAASDWVLFTALLLAFDAPLAAQGAGRLFGGVVSFVLNKFWSFESRDRTRLSSESRRFLMLFAASYGLSLTLFSGLLSLGAHPFWAKPISDVACFFFNFFMMRSYVYRQPGERPPAIDTQGIKS
jgi:putative flippase GtrA